MPICFKRLHDKAFLPSRGSPCAAGLDLYTDVGFFMSPGVICKIGTGVAAELRESLDEMDRNRRSGKAFDSSAPKHIRRRIDETLHRIDTAMAAMGANDGRS